MKGHKKSGRKLILGKWVLYVFAALIVLGIVLAFFGIYGGKKVLFSPSPCTGSTGVAGMMGNLECRYYDADSCRADMGCQPDGMGGCRPKEGCARFTAQGQAECEKKTECSSLQGSLVCNDCKWGGSSCAADVAACEPAQKAPGCYSGLQRCSVQPSNQFIEMCQADSSGSALTQNVWIRASDCGVGNICQSIEVCDPTCRKTHSCLICDSDGDSYNPPDAAYPCISGNDCDDNKADDPKETGLFGAPCPANKADCIFSTSKCAICIYPGTTEVCTDGVDNDCDGAIDRMDSDCPSDICAGKQENDACDVLPDVVEKCCSGSCVSVETSQRCGSCGTYCQWYKPKCVKLTSGLKCAECATNVDCTNKNYPICSSLGECVECNVPEDCKNPLGVMPDKVHCVKNRCIYDAQYLFESSDPERPVEDWQDEVFRDIQLNLKKHVSEERIREFAYSLAASEGLSPAQPEMNNPFAPLGVLAHVDIYDVSVSLGGLNPDFDHLEPRRNLPSTLTVNWHFNDRFYVGVYIRDLNQAYDAGRDISRGHLNRITSIPAGFGVAVVF